MTMQKVAEALEQIEKLGCTPTAGEALYTCGALAQQALALLRSDAQGERGDGALVRLKNRIDSHLDSVLCEMKPDFDDSITGFNEAWDIVRDIFKKEIASTAAAPSTPSASDREAGAEAEIMKHVRELVEIEDVWEKYGACINYTLRRAAAIAGLRASLPIPRRP